MIRLIIAGVVLATLIWAGISDYRETVRGEVIRAQDEKIAALEGALERCDCEMGE